MQTKSGEISCEYGFFPLLRQVPAQDEFLQEKNSLIIVERIEVSGLFRIDEQGVRRLAGILLQREKDNPGKDSEGIPHAGRLYRIMKY